MHELAHEHGRRLVRHPSGEEGREVPALRERERARARARESERERERARESERERFIRHFP
jgi:hypothetical protein